MRLLVFLVLLLAAPARAETYSVKGLLPDLRFQLTDEQGRAVSEASFRGRAVALYFGYSGCGDACPLTLTRLAAAVERLGPDATHVQVLFVTVTPDIDRPAVLRAYLTRYGCGCMTGVTGDGGEALARRLRAAWPVMGGDPPVHGTAVYVFDSRGHARAMVTADGDDGELAAALKAALHDRP